VGLDFAWTGDSHATAPRWAYSGFMRFRERLAKSAGMILPDDDLRVLYDREIKWPSIFAEPLVILIDHSDCEDDLSPSQCRMLAPRLRELMADWPADDYDRIHGERLAKACEECAEGGHVLRFC
jgi:hypothetical protein